MTAAEIEKRYKTAARKKNPRSGAVWQRVKEQKVTDDARYPGKGSAYWNHVMAQAAPGEDREYHENKEANPDALGFTAIGDIQSQMRNDEAKSEVVSRVRMLMDLAKQILTEQQYNVFILTMVKDPALTLREAGKVLGISFGRVRQLSDMAKAKLARAYDERTH